MEEELPPVVCEGVGASRGSSTETRVGLVE